MIVKIFFMVKKKYVIKSFFVIINSYINCKYTYFPCIFVEKLKSWHYYYKM